MNLKFFPENHTYTINDTLVPGVTSITGCLPKPWMGPWVAKETVEFIKHRIDGYPNREELFKYAKKAHKEKAREAADRGKAAHSFFEQYVKAEMAGKDKDSIVMPIDPQIRNSITLFLAWTALNPSIKWIESEVIVGHDELMFAGCFDGLLLLDGKTTLVDFKTSNSIYPEYYIQLAGYQLALKRSRPDIIIEQRAVAWFPKEGNESEFRIVPTPYELDAEVFTKALGIYRYFNNDIKRFELKEAA